MITLTFTILFANSSIKQSYADSFRYENMGNYKEAIKILKPIYQKYPKGYTLNLRLGWLFFLANRYQDSLKYYQKASFLIPSSIEPRLGICRVYLKTQYWEKAKLVAYTILQKDSFNYYANLYAVKALIGEKDFKDAKKITQKMLTLYPTDISFLELKALIESKYNINIAINIYNNILILDPNNVSARLFLKRVKR